MPLNELSRRFAVVRARLRLRNSRRRWKGQLGLSLHLGCGADRRRGFINIDSNPAVAADDSFDFRQIGIVFDPASVAEVLLIHSIAYLRLAEARQFFRDAHRVLQPGGKLAIETVDIRQASRRILESERSVLPYLEGVRAFYAFDLGQVERNEAYPPYAFGWSPWHLKSELEAAGYLDVQILPPQTHVPWRDFRIEAVRR